MWVTIDGRELSAEPGDTILKVAKRGGIAIPTLCNHDGLEPAGACRICVVEIFRSGSKSGEISAACVQPVEEGLEVKTRSPRAEKVRKNVIDLLLARCPESERIQALGRRYKLVKSSFVSRKDPDLCVLCGMCIRICEKMGASALSTAGRGKDGQVTVAFFEDTSECVGCGACAENCPTGAIEYETTPFTRKIWGKTFELARCASCGKPTLPQEQIDLLVKRTELKPSYFEKCEDCRRQEIADTFKAVMAK